ncbi:PREDICTED: chondroitin sulfate synthase 1 isoform X1 [Drosophila arizonae]|uniref:Hexosyltransferase n=1 Tax=Drosophila arizonae TaxID=7263 RepID=A0ABM1PY08_DROAR|nr:PREDICTED: chondroitin sulfate synthase 1 isoform X1 [Drosophila arizonae]XP_017872095.1 PREDICTED: chondroitin sulfate synthase 1 isoform X1 [Drosophila arizonae]XP_017872096.1 PREDICTED: chondroitin sulfate synthase 1 isoform X1 [Drosophila arizonae]
MLQHTMTKRKTLIIACFGIALGLCIGTVLKNYRALEIVKRCSMRPTNLKSPNEIIGLNDEDTIQNSQRNLVFVGVMTAKNFIEGRARAVYDTWGKEVPGRIAFFSSEGSYSDELPVVGLKNVDDRYPPQKKSFMMLYYMFEHYIDRFEWFIRADDDVYMEPDKLERFLRSIDSSKPQFIGQAGKGNSEEFGLLSLEFDENFCMGGPGVILSSETLRRVAPHIPTCLKNLYSTHEDVEVGRCVQKFAGIPCTWNYEMQYILRHNSSGRNAYTGKLKRKEIHNAITLHPIKQAPLMYRLHSYIQGLKAEELRQESLLLHRDIKRMAKYLDVPDDSTYMLPSVSPGAIPEKDTGKRHFEDHNILGISPELNKFVPASTADLLDWSFIARSLYSAGSANPKQKIDSAMREGLEDVITEVMENINYYSRQRGRVIEFRELLYGYHRLDALHGQDLILDLLLIYKKYRGKKMTVPVRRHLYVQRAFTGIFVKELDEDFYNVTLQQSLSAAGLFGSLLHNGMARLSSHFTMASNLLTPPPDTIVFVLPIAGRLATFQRFLSIYERVCLVAAQHCDLLVVIFGQPDELIDHLQQLNELRSRHIYQQINYIQRSGQFSRGVALDIAARSSYIRQQDIILFIDVDMVFNVETLQRVRMHTQRGRQVYLPIVFSQYDPKRRNGASASEQVPIDDENGYFRQFGFGICAIYKSDILDDDINGFDKDITGWGLEDVKFLEKIVRVGTRQHGFLSNTAEVPLDYNEAAEQWRRLSVFRAPDPTLVHIYHDINCDVQLDPPQYNMCLGTKANSLGSTRLMEELFFNNRQNIDFITEFNRQKHQSR